MNAYGPTSALTDDLIGEADGEVSWRRVGNLSALRFHLDLHAQHSSFSPQTPLLEMYIPQYHYPTTTSYSELTRGHIHLRPCQPRGQGNNRQQRSGPPIATT